MKMISCEYVENYLGPPCTALKEFELMDGFCELCESQPKGECWKEMILRAEHQRKIKRIAKDGNKV